LSRFARPRRMKSAKFQQILPKPKIDGRISEDMRLAQLGCRSRAAALRCNKIVEGVDLGVENFESSLTLVAVPAVGDRLARCHCLEKLSAVGSAGFIVMSRVGAGLARRRPTIASGIDVETLAAIRGFGIGDPDSNCQNCEEKHSNAQHGIPPFGAPSPPKMTPLHS